MKYFLYLFISLFFITTINAITPAVVHNVEIARLSPLFYQDYQTLETKLQNLIPDQDEYKYVLLALYLKGHHQDQKDELEGLFDTGINRKFIKDIKISARNYRIRSTGGEIE